MSSTTLQVEGSTRIVTGGGSGIGRALAKEFAAAGAQVVVGDIAAAAANETADRICARGHVAVAGHADASSTTGIRTLIDLAHTEFGAVDIYVANAGVLGPSRSGHRRRRLGSDLGSDHCRELERPCPCGGTACARLDMQRPRLLRQRRLCCWVVDTYRWRRIRRNQACRRRLRRVAGHHVRRPRDWRQLRVSDGCGHPVAELDSPIIRRHRTTRRPFHHERRGSYPAGASREYDRRCLPQRRIPGVTASRSA